MSYRTRVLADTPVTYLPLDELTGTNFASLVGGASHNGTLFGTANYGVASPRTDCVTAVALGTTSAYTGEIDLAAAAFSPANGSWAVEVFQSALRIGTFVPISVFTWRTAGGSNFLSFSGTDLKMRAFLEAGPEYVGPVISDLAFPTPTPWHHLVWSFDAPTSALTFWVDGVATGPIVGPAPSNNPSLGSMLGASTPSSPQASANFDELALYHHTLNGSHFSEPVLPAGGSGGGWGVGVPL
jgi:hypothetical protein